jgi:hypothetical protein
VYRDTQVLTERCVTVSSGSSVTARWAGQIHSTDGARVSTTFGLKSVVRDKYAGSRQHARKGGGEILERNDLQQLR